MNLNWKWWLILPINIIIAILVFLPWFIGDLLGWLGKQLKKPADSKTPQWYKRLSAWVRK